MRLPLKVLGYIYFVDENNEPKFLMLKRASDKGDFWQGVSGGLEEGETLKEGILREVQEETSLDNFEKVELLDKFYQFDDEGLWKTDYVFALKMKKKTEPNLSDEHSQYEWTSKERALKLLKFDTNKDALREVYKLIVL